MYHVRKRFRDCNVYLQQRLNVEVTLNRIVDVRDVLLCRLRYRDVVNDGIHAGRDNKTFL